MQRGNLPNELKGYSILKQLGKGTYLIEREGEQLIVKIPVKTNNVLSKLSRYVVKQDISSLNEVQVYHKLSEHKFQHFRYPEVVNVMSNKCLGLRLNRWGEGD